MSNKPIEPSIVNLVKKYLAKVASTNDYNDLDNAPTKLSDFENDIDLENITEEQIIELWGTIGSDIDPEPSVNPNVPITNEQIQAAWGLESDDNSNQG